MPLQLTAKQLDEIGPNASTIYLVKASSHGMPVKLATCCGMTAPSAGQQDGGPTSLHLVKLPALGSPVQLAHDAS